MKKISYLELAAIILTEVISLYSGINFLILKESTGINSWLSVILSYIIGFIPLLLILYIANYKKDMSIQEKIHYLYGKYIGKIINIILALILLAISVTILYNINSFTTTQFLYRTPIIISTVLLVFLIVYNANKGIDVITRVSQILMCINLVLFTISVSSLSTELKIDNFFPILKENTNKILITSLKIASINTLPLITILAIPKNKLTVPNKYNKTVIISYILGSIISFSVVIVTYGVLGQYLVNAFEFPEYMVLKKVKIFGFLQRIENIVSIQWILGHYMYLTVLLYNISKCIKHNSKKSFKYINIAIGLILIILTNQIFKNTTEFNYYIRNIFFYITSSLLIIYLLISAKIFINKRKVWYNLNGDNMCFRKKAILMIHGFVGGCYDYDNFQNELQLIKKFDVYTFTLPAHDKMIVKDVKYTDWLHEAENQLNFLISNNYKEIYLIGHSMGGVIATHLASKYSQVKKLVLVAPAFRYFYFKDGKVNIKGINETIKSLPSLLKNPDKDKIIERIAKTPITTMLEFTKLVTNCENDVKNITCPTLTIRGLDDKIVPLESTEYVYNSIKSKTNILINIKDVTHHCFTQKRKEEVKHTIKDFLIKKSYKKKETLNI